MKLNLIIVSLIICCIYPSDAATITGRVLSKISGRPTHNSAFITIFGTNKGAAIKQNGFYTISNVEPGKKYLLEVSAWGYPKTRLEIFVQDSVTTCDIEVTTECKINKTLAINDIKQDSIKLYLAGGIVPFANSLEDNEFEHKYEIEYYEFGCTPPTFECIEEYNKVIFAYLDEKYGSIWRQDVRKDVLFLPKE